MEKIIKNLISLDQEIELLTEVFDRKAAELKSISEEVNNLQKQIHDLNKKKGDIHSILIAKIVTSHKEDSDEKV